jgi:hypothetical protein
MTAPATTHARTRQTIVFAFETQEQRDELFEKLKPYIMGEAGLRVVAMSDDNEMRRACLMREASERYRHPHEIRDAIDALDQCSDLSAWSWEKFDNEETV